MNKLLMLLFIIGLVVGAYILLLVVMPTITDIINTANTTMAATSNMSNYPGMQYATVSTPWALIFIPGILGIFAIVIVLRAP